MSSDDIVTRLRSENPRSLAPFHMSDAADEIERLRAEHTFVERLVAGQLLSRMTELEADLAAERAKVERLTGELQQVAIEIALAESLEARRER